MRCWPSDKRVFSRHPATLIQLLLEMSICTLVGYGKKSETIFFTKKKSSASNISQTRLIILHSIWSRSPWSPQKYEQLIRFMYTHTYSWFLIITTRNHWSTYITFSMHCYRIFISFLVVRIQWSICIMLVIEKANFYIYISLSCNNCP